MRLDDYLQAIWRRLWMILGLVVLGGLAAWQYSSEEAPSYRSTVTLGLNPAAPSELVPFLGTGPQNLATLATSYSEILTSNGFTTMVAERLPMEDVSPAELADSISTQLTPGTPIYRISVTWRDPEGAQTMANAVAEAFIAENISRQKAKANLIQRRDEIERSVEYYAGKVGPLREKRDQLEKSLVGLTDDDLEIKIGPIERRLRDLEAIYAGYLAQLQMLRATESSSVATASIIDPAGPGQRLPSTSRQQSAIYGGVAALAIALVLVYLLEYLDFTVKKPDDVEVVTGSAPLGVVGIIPRGEKGGHDQQDSKLVTLSHPKSPISEAFRALRTSLQFSTVDRPFKALVVTSCIPGEGKTVMASNLAITLAQSGKRTLLVDVDLRRPNLHKVFRVGNKDGFSTLILEDQRTIQEVIQRTDIPNLWLLTSGPLPPNPAELLGSQRVERLISDLRQMGDCVVFDSPPVGPVTDAVILSKKADATLLVVQTGKIRKDMLAKILANLQRMGANVVGVALNRIQPGDLGSYAYYYYYYYYERYSGYGSQPRRASKVEAIGDVGSRK